MCGIGGFLDTSRRSREQDLRDTVLSMVNTLHHRGPDDVGTWADAEAGIALGYRRLAIVDLSPEGHQPMRSVCARYVISFNGEIYNFQELRRELEGVGYTFRGHSDTEVMLSCISEWGIHAAMTRLNGKLVVFDLRLKGMFSRLSSSSSGLGTRCHDPIPAHSGSCRPRQAKAT
jgi:asparagine synthase (glutamine-hydrolysing)